MNILDQLATIAAERNHDYDTIVLRYLIERTLFRLGEDRAEIFVLKGGLYLGLLSYEPYRATADTDLSAFRHQNNETLKEIFEDLKNTNPCPQDGVSYSGKIKPKIISGGRNYQGVRIKIKAHLQHESRRLSFDISHGSALSQDPLPWEFSTIVSGLPEPSGIRLYPLESVVAEKLHAFHFYPAAESFPRIRDLYDLAYLASTTSFDATKLYKAIIRTFESRKPTLLNGDIFWSDRPSSLTNLDAIPERQQEWGALLDGATYQPEISDAVRLVGRFSNPLLDAVYTKCPYQGTWRCGDDGDWESSSLHL